VIDRLLVLNDKLPFLTSLMFFLSLFSCCSHCFTASFFSSCFSVFVVDVFVVDVFVDGVGAGSVAAQGLPISDVRAAHAAIVDVPVNSEALVDSDSSLRSAFTQDDPQLLRY